MDDQKMFMAKVAKIFKLIDTQNPTEYRHALKLVNSLIKQSSFDRNFSIYLKGVVLAKLKDLVGSNEVYKSLLKKRLSNKQRILTLSSSVTNLIALKRYSQAITTCNAILSIDGKNHSAFEHRAVAEVGLKRKKAALRDFRMAHKLNPQCNSCLHNLGIFYKQNNNEAKAVALFTRVLRRNPKYVSSIRCLIELNYEKKRFGKAEKYIDMLLKIDGRVDWIANEYKAKVSLQLNKINTAFKYYRKTLNMRCKADGKKCIVPGSITNQFSEILYSLGKLELALKVVNEGLRFNGKNKPLLARKKKLLRELR